LTKEDYKRKRNNKKTTLTIESTFPSVENRSFLLAVDGFAVDLDFYKNKTRLMDVLDSRKVTTLVDEGKGGFPR
jgi:hypothetical protein